MQLYVFYNVLQIDPHYFFAALFAICLQRVVTDHYQIVLCAPNDQCVPLIDNSCDVLASYLSFIEN